MVGAGVVGCGVAYELSCRGARVRVVEARGPGRGATWASAGMLAPYIEGHDPRMLSLGLASLALYDAFVARVRADSTCAVFYERSGTLQVSLDDHEAVRLDAEAAAMTAAGADVQRLDGRAARALEPALSGRVVTALAVASHGHVAAAALTSALARAAAARGATYVPAQVHTVSPTGSGVRLETSAGPLDADAVVLAAGAWSATVRLGDRPPMPAPPVIPVRGQLLHLRQPRRTTTRVIWHGSSYLVPWADGTLLAGATVEDVGFDERQTPEAERALRAAATAIVPASATADLVDARAGLRPGTPDGLPIVGPSSTMPGVFYATGHYRNGVLLAPLTAALVADLVLDGRRGDALAHTRPDRFGW